MDVAFEMVYGDKGDVLGECQGLCIGDPNQKRSCETGAGGNCDGVQIVEGNVGLRQSGADNGHDGAEMLTAGQLGNDSAIAGVGGDLGSDSRGECAGAALDNGSGGLVAGGFDGEDEAVAHLFSLAGGVDGVWQVSIPLMRDLAG